MKGRALDYVQDGSLCRAIEDKGRLKTISAKETGDKLEAFIWLDQERARLSALDLQPAAGSAISLAGRQPLAVTELGPVQCGWPTSLEL
ncbi:hypothetical protein VTO42DRAFT_7730 [Malbranchea cinnamomea]